MNAHPLSSTRVTMGLPPPRPSAPEELPHDARGVEAPAVGSQEPVGHRAAAGPDVAVSVDGVEDDVGSGLASLCRFWDSRTTFRDAAC
jgi:hypothetical protein